MDKEGSSLVRSSSRKMKEGQEEGSHELPSDVLRIIIKKLGITDLISFGQVCKSWRRIYSYTGSWRNFMASHVPFILQKTLYSNSSHSLYSISDARSYDIWPPYFSGFSFVGFSSEYIIMVSFHAFMLINPFTGKTITIPKLDDDDMSHEIYRASLGFSLFNLKDFILVTIFSRSFQMYVYISRHSKWYLLKSRDRFPLKIMDVELKGTSLYAITDKAKVGIVMLDEAKNSKSLGFHELFAKPPFAVNSRNLKLVNTSDNELLVVDFKPSQLLAIYKIQLMEWKRLETLRDCALFLGAKTKCFSLSNPSKWGLESNCVYYIDHTSAACKVISMDNQVIRTISLPESQDPHGVEFCNIGWCFRHERDEMYIGDDE